MNAHILLSSALLVVASQCAAAAERSPEERLLAALRRAHPHTTFTAVERTPLPDVYLVRMGANVAFARSGNTRYLVFGHLFDTATLSDLTPAATSAAPQIEVQAAPLPLAQLPLADALVEVHGSGARKLAVFSDPRCPYCRQLDGELAKLSDVTLYHFVVPFLGTDVPAAVWCAPDRLKALRAALRDAPLATAAATDSCAQPVARNAVLAARIGVHGTPTMLFADGGRLEGFTTANEIESRLLESERSNHD